MIKVGGFYRYLGKRVRVINMHNSLPFYDSRVRLEPFITAYYWYEIMFEDLTTTYTTAENLKED